MEIQDFGGDTAPAGSYVTAQAMFIRLSVKYFHQQAAETVNVKPWLTMMLVIKDEDFLYVTYAVLKTRILRNINSEF